MLQVAWSEHALVNTVNTKRWWIKATTQMWDRWVKATPVSPPWPGGSLHVGQLWSDCKSKMCFTVLLFDPVRFHRCGSCVSPLRSQVSSVLVSLDAPFHLKLLFVSMCAIRWEKNSQTEDCRGECEANTTEEGGDTGGCPRAVWLVPALLRAPTPVWQACHESSCWCHNGVGFTLTQAYAIRHGTGRHTFWLNSQRLKHATVWVGQNEIYFFNPSLS